MNKLLLHICCAPDATVAFERTAPEWEVIGFFFNPNIEPVAEFELRASESERLAKVYNIEHFTGTGFQQEWLSEMAGYEDQPERGERCRRCIEFRLNRSAQYCVENGILHFTTTLTTSPHKDVDFIHQKGMELSEQYGLVYLPETFRKKDGFKRSLEICRDLSIYRQNYCGCRWSLGS